MSTKRFTHLNEGFTCSHCGFEVPSQKGSCRNHCTHCLYSLHVDLNPGDRLHECRGLMKPVAVQIQGDKKTLVHLCLSCGEEKRNRCAEDDDFQTLLSIMRDRRL